MSSRLIPIILCFLLWATPAQAARIFASGWDTCDDLEFTDGGTTALTTASSDARTGRCALRSAPVSGGNAWHQTPAFTADGDMYARVYLKIETSTTGGRAFFGLWGDSHYGCRIDVETDNSLTLRFKDRGSSGYLSFGQTGALAAGYHSAEIHQINGSGDTCTPGPCQVSCELWLDGAKVITATNDSILTADYDKITSVVIGAAGSELGAGVVLFDDLVIDTDTQIGSGTVQVLTPDGDGSGGTPWNNSCGGTKAGCIDEFASGTDPHDTESTYIDENTVGRQQNLTLTTFTIGADNTLESVTGVSIGRAITDDGRSYEMNHWDGTNTIDGTTHAPGTTYEVERTLSLTAPDTTAWNVAEQGDLDGLEMQLEHLSGNEIRVTAILVYVDRKEPDPPITQNLQDKNNDNRLVFVTLGDSITEGTGLGSCSGNQAVQCGSNIECSVCSNDTSILCDVDSDCGASNTCPDYSPCQNTGKYPTILSSQVTQSLSEPNAFLQCGINGNTCTDLATRVPDILTGVGMRTKRFCIRSMTECTPDDAGCTAKQCASEDCESTGNGATCALSCQIILGSAVCSGDHSVECEADSDCVLTQTCSDLPGGDYFFTLCGANDFHLTDDPNCIFDNTAGCPDIVTSAPSGFELQRISCNDTDECQSGKFCSNDATIACDADSDCGASNTCDTGTLLAGSPNCVNTCSGDTTEFCTANFHCSNGETCTTNKMCSARCAQLTCSTDSDCGPAPVILSSGEQIYTQDGTCSGGVCTNCGPPGCTASTQHDLHLKNLSVNDTIEDLIALDALITGDANPRTHIVLTHPHIISTCNSFGWSGIIDRIKLFRSYILENQPNAVDIDMFFGLNDDMIHNNRCNGAEADIICTADSDCSGSCITYNSTLRPASAQNDQDGIHLNARGAALLGRVIGEYIHQLAPVCSEDGTTACGKCSVTTATSCTTSDDCPEDEKCVATDSECTGTCTLERAGKLCSQDLTTTCTADSDCVGVGTCEDEGLIDAGAG